MNIICKCGADIPDDEIEITPHTNSADDGGEDWEEVTAFCKVCNRDFRASTWGSYEDKEDAKEDLLDHNSALTKKPKLV